MIRMIFDRDYIDGLEDYYHRNECIREQQYLSPEKLLHLASFCVSKVVNSIDKSGRSQPNGPKLEAALDAVRQLSLLCQPTDHTDARNGTTLIVNGQTNVETQHEKHKPISAPPTA